MFERSAVVVVECGCLVGVVRGASWIVQLSFLTEDPTEDWGLLVCRGLPHALVCLSVRRRSLETSLVLRHTKGFPRYRRPPTGSRRSHPSQTQSTESRPSVGWVGPL